MRKLHLSIDSELENIALVGSCIRCLSTETPLSENCCYDLELAVVEGLTNIVKHAYGNRPGHLITLELSFHDDRLTVDIYDTGKTLDTTLLARRQLPPADAGGLEKLPESGWGLYLIKHCVDKIDYEIDGKTHKLSLSKYFPESSES